MLNITTEMKNVLSTIKASPCLQDDATDSLIRELDALAWEQLTIDYSLPPREAEDYYFTLIGEGWSVVLRGDPWNFFVNGKRYMAGNCRLNVAMYLIDSAGILPVPKRYRVIWNGVTIRS